MIAEDKLVDYGEGFTTPHYVDDGGAFSIGEPMNLIGKVLVEGVPNITYLTRQQVIDRQLAQHILTPFGEYFKGEFIPDTVEEITARVNAWCDRVGE